MHCSASGTISRIVLRNRSRVPRLGSSSAARYSSTSRSDTLPVWDHEHWMIKPHQGLAGVLQVTASRAPLISSDLVVTRYDLAAPLVGWDAHRSDQSHAQPLGDASGARVVGLR